MRKLFRASLAVAVAIILASCTIHPSGEEAERRAALAAGKPFVQPRERREVPPLPDNPSAVDLVRHALLCNAELEKRYWEWRSAIEQIPQDGTQPTNLAIFAGGSLMNGRASSDRATLGVGNDPMADILLPPKLSTAARRALDRARAAGELFRQTQFELRAKVLTAYADYRLTAELVRLEQSNAELLATTVTSVEARNRAGIGSRQDLLKARNELDLSRNNLVNMQSQLPAQRAALNGMLDRDVDAPISVTTNGGPPTKIVLDDATVLRLAARRSPEMSALADEILARRKTISLARLQYLPDISLSAGTDFAGVTQSLTGMVTAPFLRYEAIRAAVAQAEAGLRAAEAERRQAENDLAARVVLDLSTLRDAERQLELFEQSVLPRTREIVSAARTAYETGQASLLDLLDAQRSLIAIERLRATLAATHEKRLASVESVTGRQLGSTLASPTKR